MASIFTRARLLAFSKFAAATAVVVPTGFHLWTRQCSLDESFSPATDSLFQHPFLKKVNPDNNGGFHDCFVREVAYENVRPGLLEDALGGGSKLVETYAAGVWGRYGEWERNRGGTWISSAKLMQLSLYSGNSWRGRGRMSPTLVTFGRRRDC